MSKRIRIPLWLAIFDVSLMIAAASPPVIGVARSRTFMLVNHASAPGVATILDGTSLETIDTPSNVNLSNGGRVLLAPNSSARILQDRLVLDRGCAELSGSPLYRIETTDFRVSTSSPASHIQVVVLGAGRVHVEAVGGTAEVHNAQGVLVAKLQSSTALQLQMTNASSTQLVGTVRSRDGKFFLTDEVSSVGVELRGGNLANLVGRRVEIVGSRLAGAPALADASQAVAVSRAMLAFDRAGDETSADAPDPDPSPDPSQNPPSASSTSPPPSRKNKRKKVALIIVGGAVVVGGTLGGLAAAGTIGGSSRVSP